MNSVHSALKKGSTGKNWTYAKDTWIWPNGHGSALNFRFGRRGRSDLIFG